jgi:hypothetical protein
VTFPSVAESPRISRDSVLSSGEKMMSNKLTVNCESSWHNSSEVDSKIRLPETVEKRRGRARHVAVRDGDDDGQRRITSVGMAHRFRDVEVYVVTKENREFRFSQHVYLT